MASELAHCPGPVRRSGKGQRQLEPLHAIPREASAIDRWRTITGVGHGLGYSTGGDPSSSLQRFFDPTRHHDPARGNRRFKSPGRSDLSARHVANLTIVACVIIN
jgi:hypothetical protein